VHGGDIVHAGFHYGKDAMRFSFLILFLLWATTTVAESKWRGHEETLTNHPTIQAMHRIHTAHRARHGLPPQKLNSELCRSAQDWSEWMARTGSFNHSPWNVAENIAMGQESASDAMNAWMNSRGHNANLLGGAGQVGFGVAESSSGHRYWTSCHGSGFKTHGPQ